MKIGMVTVVIVSSISHGWRYITVFTMVIPIFLGKIAIFWLSLFFSVKSSFFLWFPIVSYGYFTIFKPTLSSGRPSELITDITPSTVRLELEPGYNEKLETSSRPWIHHPWGVMAIGILLLLLG
jgi:hypothetical protein